MNSRGQDKMLAESLLLAAIGAGCAGAEYLLLLRRGELPAYAQPNQLTPYWTPLMPTNEQLFGGARDAWFVWVRHELQR